MQSLFESFYENIVSIVKGRLNVLQVEYCNDIVLRQIFSDTSFFELTQNKFMTDHLLQRYLTENMRLNEPVVIKYAKSKLIPGSSNNSKHRCIPASKRKPSSCSESNPKRQHASCDNEGEVCINYQYHYVPILVTLKHYLEQPDVWACCQKIRALSDKLCDFTDGSVWRNFSAPATLFIRIHLYSDEVEIDL